MDITTGQTVYVRNDIAQAVQVHEREIVVKFANGMHLSVNPNECVPMTGRQVHAYILLAEIVYLLPAERTVSEVIAGVRVGFNVDGEHHAYVIDELGTLSAVGTPSESMARLHQEALAYLG